MCADDAVALPRGGFESLSMLDCDLFEEFCREFTLEMNRLRLGYRASLSSAEAELERLEAKRKKLVQSIMDGVPGAEVGNALANDLRTPSPRNSRVEVSKGGDACRKKERSQQVW